MLHSCTTWKGYATQSRHEAQPGKVMLQRHSLTGYAMNTQPGKVVLQRADTGHNLQRLGYDASVLFFSIAQIVRLRFLQRYVF